MAEKTINVTLIPRADTEANFNTGNPLLRKGELAISLDKNGAYKVGDGSNRWKNLEYNKALSASSADSVAWSAITDKPSTYTPSTHTHAATDVTGLANLLTGTSGYIFTSNGNSAPTWSNVLDGGVEAAPAENE